MTTRIIKILTIIIIVLGIILVLQLFKNKEIENTTQPISKNEYSLYLAGSYAKKISDFDNATIYFDKLEKTDKSENIKKDLYILSIINGNFEKAKTIKIKGDNTLLYIDFANLIKENKLKEANKVLNQIPNSKNEVLKHLLQAWIYAGFKDKEKAYGELSKIKIPEFKEFVSQQKIYIAIYFKDKTVVKEELEKFKNKNLNVRFIQVIVEYFCEENDFKSAKGFVDKKLSDESIKSALNKYIINYSKQDKLIFENIDEGMSETFGNFAQIIFNPKSWELSVFFARLSLYMYPSNEFSKVLLAEILESKNITKEALLLYKDISPQSYLYESSLIKRANILYKEGKKKEGLKLFEDLINKNPSYITAYIFLGEKYIEEGNYKKALKIFETAKSELKEEDKKDWKLYFYLAFCYDKLGKKDLVEDNLASALVLSPNNPMVQNYLGFFWINNDKNTDQALKMIEGAVLSNPLNIEYIDSFSWALYKGGKKKEALKLLELCAQRSAANPYVRMHLSEIYYEEGRIQEAKYQAKSALLFKEGLNSEDIKKLEKILK